MLTFELINNSTTRSQAKYHSMFHLDYAENRLIEVYSKSGYLILMYTSKGKSEDTQNQLEIPILSLLWIKESILNGFWKKPSDGGFPKNKHACKAIFETEVILISRSMNAGYPGKMGVKIVNKSRSSHILPTWPQEIQITDDAVKAHLLPVIDKLTEGID
ncbi:hypothetical protein [Photobacterium lutimaris]|uniref:Uncharacterized protein n=1 Tax=Photobacterium lutimaris TaxID=388278 RepID=A0A2T3IH47_9GAMM|nr:hypothetical protein [Photobacterium lutimaris]PSU26968.1 hypothetical protein C9I99_26790 [Photobacterium lutimaris]TDR69718.1 hypothetical protein DFP78_1372 [Photobacterium lutimaris]